MAKTIVGIFDSYDLAEKAARQIKDNGLRTDDISIVARDNNQQGAQETGTFTNENRGINDNVSDGTVTGGVLGGLAGLLLGMGTMVIPGLGVIAAAGPIAGLLSGALTGGIVGGLVDLGIPEEAGREYEREVRQGRVLWSMRTEEANVDKVSNILRNCGARNVEVH
ncbi:MAG: hypothetical protein JG777_2728 [Clostridia bacterium]|jgi:uncharacterized membrane protein|uniref:general stress protein n=1 Tax=Petroclostridium xylanilyticum TaxID=1792311 RepID=UPI000B994F77|nr:general stress protein [Petroclostridium xylanilyticum]MBZ4647239.1 hypothetical protein [Clostridia bacterium]